MGRLAGFLGVNFNGGGIFLGYIENLAFFMCQVLFQVSIRQSLNVDQVFLWGGICFQVFLGGNIFFEVLPPKVGLLVGVPPGILCPPQSSLIVKIGFSRFPPPPRSLMVVPLGSCKCFPKIFSHSQILS